MNLLTTDVTPPTMKLSSPPLQFPALSTKTLAPSTTYSFNETIFARRLARTTLEAGFRLLSSANSSPATLSYKFGLSLPYQTIDQLRVRFKKVLLRGTNDDLDWWQTPFIHLGGAGTHYPRRDATGNITPIENGWTVRQVGPLEERMVRFQRVEDGHWDDLDGIDLSEFGGEWFDAYDVQGYLEEQYACKINSNNSFSECLVEEENLGSISHPLSALSQYNSSRRQTSYKGPSPTLTHSSTNSSNSSITSSVLSENPHGLSKTAHHGMDMGTNYLDNYPKLVNYDAAFNPTLDLDPTPGLGNKFVDNAGFRVSDVQLGLDATGQKRKKSAWVDVGRLITGECNCFHQPSRMFRLMDAIELTKKSVCLGRAPGFRKKDVDMAIQTALVTAS